MDSYLPASPMQPSDFPSSLGASQTTKKRKKVADAVTAPSPDRPFVAMEAAPSKAFEAPRQVAPPQFVDLTTGPDINVAETFSAPKRRIKSSKRKVASQKRMVAVGPDRNAPADAGLASQIPLADGIVRPDIDATAPALKRPVEAPRRQGASQNRVAVDRTVKQDSGASVPASQHPTEAPRFTSDEATIDADFDPESHPALVALKESTRAAAKFLSSSVVQDRPLKYSRADIAAMLKESSRPAINLEDPKYKVNFAGVRALLTSLSSLRDANSSSSFDPLASTDTSLDSTPNLGDDSFVDCLPTTTPTTSSQPAVIEGIADPQQHMAVCSASQNTVASPLTVSPVAALPGLVASQDVHVSRTLASPVAAVSATVASQTSTAFPVVAAPIATQTAAVSSVVVASLNTEASPAVITPVAPGSAASQTSSNSPTTPTPLPAQQVQPVQPAVVSGPDASQTSNASSDGVLQPAGAQQPAPRVPDSIDWVLHLPFQSGSQRQPFSNLPAESRHALTTKFGDDFRTQHTTFFLNAQKNKNHISYVNFVKLADRGIRADARKCLNQYMFSTSRAVACDTDNACGRCSKKGVLCVRIVRGASQTTQLCFFPLDDNDIDDDSRLWHEKAFWVQEKH
ncbi:hypothetical protein HBH70_200590 [Parastagonospora nodorum]|nr:hypothetical protein HBH49_227670 [Parastagonospora nodorum]KAH4095327.1 hypothetical protein HBH46_171970 [Parastagonospora nodorum]KAH4115476.1 hypothetical protein HBH47_180710 [Parastagonospora nodorum]KAH5129892.1 hypothetical protein HBH70_200590 [Parastagonospora nodorum]KAH5210462.1 hypothetical protein HBI62_207290 [Parastagonospora nodorum]